MLVTRTSMVSGIKRTLEIAVTDQQIAVWQSGVSIELAMPSLSAADREFVISGITDAEWQEFCEELD